MKLLNLSQFYAPMFKSSNKVDMKNTHPNVAVADPGGDWGDRTPVKPTKVTLFIMILYNLEDNISKPISIKSLSLSSCSKCLIVRDIRPFCRAFVSHSSIEKHTSSFLQQRSRYKTWLPNLTEIASP